MTGMELSRKLMELRPDIPIILCTGFSEGLNVKKVLSNGIKEFVMKPVPAKDITCAIEKALSKSQANLKPS